jgi:SIT4 phosphatase-associated protein.
MYVYFFKPVFQELFFKYTWNNFLHSQVEQCIAFAMNSELSLSIENDASENVLLQNVSTLYTNEIFFIWHHQC